MKPVLCYTVLLLLRMLSDCQPAVLLPTEGQTSSSMACPAMCTCSFAEAAKSGAVQWFPAEQSQSIMAQCWLEQHETNQIPCAPNWRILHLQVIASRQGNPKSMTLNDKAYTRLHSNIFASCASIRRLAIWEKSQINTITRHVFRPLNQLHRLVIQVPALTRLPDHMFQFLTTLQFLSISKAEQLTQLQSAIFQPCPRSLHTVRLTDCNFKGSLPFGLFQQCDFTELALSQNSLTQLEWGSLTGLKRLSHLRLDRNHLSGTLEQCFGYNQRTNSSTLTYSTPNLETLDLSHNSIKGIDGMMWSGECRGPLSPAIPQPTGLCLLQRLNLAYNQLHWIDLNAFRGLPSLSRLSLQGNPRLYRPDSAGSLSLALYTVTLTRRVPLHSILLPINTTENLRSSNSTRLSTGRQQQQTFIDACKAQEQMLTWLPRSVREIVRHVNKSSCAKESQATLTTATLQLTTATNHLNHSPEPIATNDFIAAFLCQTSSIYLFLLVLLIFLVGNVVGCLLTCFIAACTRRRDITTITHSPNTRQLLGKPIQMQSPTGAGKVNNEEPVNLVNTRLLIDSAVGTPLPVRANGNNNNNRPRHGSWFIPNPSYTPSPIPGLPPRYPRHQSSNHHSSSALRLTPDTMNVMERNAPAVPSRLQRSQNNIPLQLLPLSLMQHNPNHHRPMMHSSSFSSKRTNESIDN